MRRKPELNPAAATPGPVSAAEHGALPPAYHEARRSYRQGRISDALTALARIIGPTGRWAGPGGRAAEAGRREAALLKAWCLIEQKEPAATLEWLSTARRLHHLAADDLTAQVIELNARLYAEDFADIQTTATELLTLCRDPADLNHAELRLILGACLRWQGQLSDAMGHVEFACSAFTILDEPGRCAVAANFLGWTCLSLGRLNESRRWFEKSLGINTRLDAKLRMAQNYQNLAIICYKQGDYGLAVELLDKELKLVGRHPDMTCRALIALGNVRRLQGEYFGARTALLDAYAVAGQEKLRREEALALEFLGDVFRDEGQPGNARRYYARGLAVARELAPRGDLVMELTRRRGECLDLENRHDEAEPVLYEALEMCRAVGDRFETAVTQRCLGVNAANLGRWKLARKQLEAALEGLQGLTARRETMVASYELSLLLTRQIDAGTATGRTGRILDLAWQHGLRAQQLNQELESPVLSHEVTAHLATLARRRLVGPDHKPARGPFSTRRAPVSRVIAVSPAMQQTLRRCDGFARYDTPVLLYGEPGTGKELLAHRIHENSPRGAQPFIRVCCAETAGNLLARELFGHADNGRETIPGLIAQAAGGTLFLGSIDELPRELQVKLLRLIQEGIFRPTGGGRDRQADVRVIATTARDLAHLADQHRFRQDLYFRLRLMSVTVPPLRERPEDIVPLADHFLSRLEGSTVPVRSLLDFSALEMLTTYHWPGNADELETLAQQAWLQRDLGHPQALASVETPDGTTLELQELVGAAAGSTHPSGMTHDSLTALIRRSGGNKARVARNLGVSRVTLYRWLQQLDTGVA